MPARPVVIFLVLIAPVAALADDSANVARLLAMPREKRVVLRENLDRFDALPSGDREAIRELDASLARLDPAVQARYRVVLRRYHVWVKGLTDDQRKRLAQATSTTERLDLVTKWKRAEVQADTRAKSNTIFGVQAGDLGAIPPFEIANALNVWFSLNAADKKRVEEIQRFPLRISTLTEMGRRRSITMSPFPPEIEAEYLKRIERDEKANVFNRMPAPAKVEPGPAAKKAERLNTFSPLHHLAESLYFNEHPPAPVSLANLELFEAKIPPWLRASLDPLPPDDARRRLTILYRQIYPPGKEVEPPPKAEATSKAPSPPAPKKAAGVGPQF